MWSIHVYNVQKQEWEREKGRSLWMSPWQGEWLQRPYMHLLYSPGRLPLATKLFLGNQPSHLSNMATHASLHVGGVLKDINQVRILTSGMQLAHDTSLWEPTHVLLLGLGTLKVLKSLLWWQTNWPTDLTWHVRNMTERTKNLTNNRGGIWELEWGFWAAKEDFPRGHQAQSPADAKPVQRSRRIPGTWGVHLVSLGQPHAGDYISWGLTSLGKLFGYFFLYLRNQGKLSRRRDPHVLENALNGNYFQMMGPPGIKPGWMNTAWQCYFWFNYIIKSGWTYGSKKMEHCHEFKRFNE